MPAAMMAERSFLLVARVAVMLFWFEIKGKSSVRGHLTGVLKVSTTLGGFFTGRSTHSVCGAQKGRPLPYRARGAGVSVAELIAPCVSPRRTALLTTLRAAVSSAPVAMRSCTHLNGVACGEGTGGDRTADVVLDRHHDHSRKGTNDDERFDPTQKRKRRSNTFA
jgi:hypothetical protein